MPSVEKAILNPNASLSVGDALLVVFMMLAILAVVIMVISKVVGSMEGKGKAAPAPAKKAAAAPKPAAAPAAPAVDEGELVAVMMAAVAEESGMPMGSFQITNIAAAPAAPAGGDAAGVAGGGGDRAAACTAIFPWRDSFLFLERLDI